jgi:hypothetical protein
MEIANTCPQAPRCERIVALNEKLVAVGTLYAGAILMTATAGLIETLRVTRQIDAEMAFVPAAENRCDVCPLSPEPQEQPTA